MNLPHFNFPGSSNGLHYGDRLRPARDWFALLCVLGLLLLVGVVWSAFTFVAVKRGEVIGNAPAATHMPVDRASLQSVEDLFATRAKEAEKYTNGVYSFVDPAK